MTKARANRTPPKDQEQSRCILEAVRELEVAGELKPAAGEQKIERILGDSAVRRSDKATQK